MLITIPRDQTGGLINSDQSVGGDYAQSVDVDNSTSAAATTTDGNADANASEYSSFGILNSDIDVEGNYDSTVSNDNSITSAASTTDGSANADSTSTERTGIRFDSSSEPHDSNKLDVEGNAKLAVSVGDQVDPNMVSSAASVVGEGDATAVVNTVDNYGITGTSLESETIPGKRERPDIHAASTQKPTEGDLGTKTKNIYTITFRIHTKATISP